MNEGPLRTVATGLRLVYAGLGLMMIVILGQAFFSIIIMYRGFVTLTTLGLVGITSLSLILLAIVLDVIGRLMCLALPADRSGSRPIIFVSVLCSLAPLAVSAWTLGTVSVRLPPLPQIVLFLQTPVAVLGSVLFVVFLRNLAFDVQQPALARRAVTVLIFGFLTVLALAGFQLYSWAGGPGGLVTASRDPVLIGNLLLLVLGITTLILYGNLLTYLRAKVLQYAANPPRVPVPTD
jgi:hypothetical protein